MKKTPKNTTDSNHDSKAARPGEEDSMSSDWVGTDLIRAERERQIEAEGWSPEHDDAHDEDELIFAALTYASHAKGDRNYYPDWPFEESFKPDATKIGNLVKAGALIAAEIDRLQRKRREVPTE